jgi:hypothetical protein
MLAVEPRCEGEPPWAAVADCAQLLAGECDGRGILSLRKAKLGVPTEAILPA